MSNRHNAGIIILVARTKILKKTLNFFYKNWNQRYDYPIYLHTFGKIVSDDLLYEIDSFYALRPDILAHDLYGSSKLWWVFMHRNMDTLTDPVWSFTAGTEIRIPKKTALEKYLGV